MSITEATEFFKILLKESNNKQETKVYKRFIAILDSLKSVDLEEVQLLLIEDEINSLNLKSAPENKRKYFRNKLAILKKYLKHEFSLISEGYYLGLYMSMGMCYGVAFGTCFGFVFGFGPIGGSIGVSLGMLLGLIIGRNKDLEAEKNNRVLKNEFSN